MNQLNLTRILPSVIVMLCLAGAWISGELVRLHADPQTGAGLLGRMCTATGDSGCAQAMQSRWSAITVPVPRPTSWHSVAVAEVTVPVAFMGLAYFTFMLVWFGLLGRPRPYGRPWHRLPLHVGYAGATTSAFYLGLMVFGVAPWCLLCLLVHGLNALLVAAVWRLNSSEPARRTGLGATPLPEDAAGLTVTTRQALGTIAVATLIVGGLWLYRREHLQHLDDRHRLLPYQALVKSLQRDPEFLLREYYAQPWQTIPLRVTEAGRNDQRQLVVFTDFECPGCYCDAMTFQKRLVELFKGRLAIRVRHFPLCNDCNESVAGTLHPNACRAAAAAEAARLLGGEPAFSRMHELLFENRHRLGGELYRELAVEIGVDAELLLGRMESEAVRRIIEADIALAAALGVTGTPTMFLDGRRVPELCRSAVFWRAYAQATIDQGELASALPVRRPLN